MVINWTTSNQQVSWKTRDMTHTVTNENDKDLIEKLGNQDSASTQCP